jgi:hypothetical protein
MSKRHIFLTNKCWLEFGKQMFWPNICVAKRLISQKRINQIDLNLYSPKKKMYCIQKTVVNNEMRPTKNQKGGNRTGGVVRNRCHREVKQ